MRGFYYYWILYFNRFLYLEEGILLVIFAAVSALVCTSKQCFLVFLIFFLLALLLLSPRSPLVKWVDSVLSLPAEIPPPPPNAARPNTPTSFLMHDEGLFDATGRRVFLRGVNVSGKLPLGHTTWTYYPPRKGSFVGSLFDLETIDTHLRRLAGCGFTLLRLNVPWEALEPESEGVYDAAYIAYLLAVVRACARHGMWVVIDSHQDAWSRWTGGDGAPKWTMERLGMRPDVFAQTRSAWFHRGKAGHIWFTNYTLYGAGTMLALFFGGNRFAPATKVAGVNVQAWLQGAYIRAWCEVARVLAEERNVLGFEPMNEPNAGWIGLEDLRRLPLPVLIGWALSPWESIRLANGASFKVASFSGVNTYSGSRLANRNRQTCFCGDGDDVWKQNGVWAGGDSEHLLIRPGHFSLPRGETFEKDFLAPFVRDFARAILRHNPRWWIVCHPIVHGIPTAIDAPHWYDGLTLIMNRYIAFMGISSDQSFVYPCYAPYAHRKALECLIPTQKNKGPIFLGEVGMTWLGSARKTARALEATLSAVDARFPSAVAVWNYNPRHSQEVGDGWNLEDFSIWSPALAAFRMPNAVRPYAMVLAGRPVAVEWRPGARDKRFVLEFEVTGNSNSNLSVIFVPRMHYTGGVRVWTSDGGAVFYDERLQVVEYRHESIGGGEGNTTKKKVIAYVNRDHYKYSTLSCTK